MSSIDIRGLSKRFGAAEVLRGLDLHVPSGAVTAILGSSGSGKSTLLRCIAGLLRPDAGRISLGDRDVCAMPRVWVPPEDRAVGLVPQEGSLFPHLDVAGNIGFGLRGRDRKARVEHLLELMGLPGAGGMRPHELSGGMQQRVAVARALAPRPAVVLLDEPFSALDAGLRDDVRRVVFDAIRADGATAVLVTHDQEEAFAVADRVAVMMDATIAQDAPPEQVYLEPATLAVARFVGDTVLLPASGVGEHSVRTGFGSMSARNAVAAGQQGVLVFRPEDLAVEAAGEPIAAGTVTDVRYHGHDTVVSVQTDGQVLHIRALGQHGLHLGDRVEVSAVRPGAFFAEA
jgi:iron(III) transport system ATP-binding protein